MTQYREGLNYIPMLAQNISPPPSSRSCISVNKKRSERSVLSYNGNYEGDISMFRDKGYDLDRFNLLDSDSDDNEGKGISSQPILIVQSSHTQTVQYSLLWRLLQHFIWNSLKPEMQLQIVERLQRIMDSVWYRNSLIYYNGLRYICELIMRFIVKIINYMAFLCHFLWTRRLILRSILRSILWWLTLAKCNDLALFALILMSAPVLFIVALMGFTVALCGCLRDKIQNWSYTINYTIKYKLF